MLITQGTVVLPNDTGTIGDGAVFVESGVIRAVGTRAELEKQYAGAEVVDAHGALIMPGNINAHTHFYGAFARGMAVPGEPPADFPAILRQLWWNLDKALDADAVRLSALVSLVDAVKSGTTTLFDHHASPNHIDGSLSIIAAAVREAGVRAALCYEVTDRDGSAKAEAGIAENVRFLRDEAQRDEQVRGLFGLHASMTLSDRTLRTAVESNTFDVGFHIHVAEHQADQIDSLAKSGNRTVYRLHNAGVLSAQTLAAHCIHVDEGELAQLSEAEAWVTHQPRSNMNNAVGAMPFEAMNDRRMKVLLGSDGFFGSMWEEMKAAYFLHKHAARDPRVANGAVIAQAAQRAHDLAGSVFGGQFGRIEVGARADIILVDYHPFTPLTAGNLPWHILFGMEASMVNTTIVGGQMLMRDRKLLTLDERAIAEAARAIAPGVWARCAEIAEHKK